MERSGGFFLYYNFSRIFGYEFSLIFAMHPPGFYIKIRTIINSIFELSNQRICPSIHFPTDDIYIYFINNFRIGSLGQAMDGALCTSIN
jgi:hypothetical protein